VRKSDMLVVGLALIEGLALAQNPPAVPAAKLTDKNLCTVTGQVLRSGTNLPLKKAYIHMRSREEGDRSIGYGAQTDDSGHFSISKIQPGRYSLFVDRVGYVRQSYGQTASARQGAILALAAGESAHDLVFRMVPWSVIAGRITNEDGEPISYADVTAMRSSVENGKRTLESVGWAQTNDLGEYRIWGLAKGLYYIRAESKKRFVNAYVGRISSPSSPAEAPTGYAPIYYPGTPDLGHAATVELRAGQEMPSENFILIPTRASRVSGHVYNTIQAGKSVFASVQLSRLDDSGIQDSSQQTAVDSSNGVYAFDNVVPGSYEVTAWTEIEGKGHTAHRRIEVGETNIEDANLTIARGADVRGRVTLEGQAESTLSGAIIFLEPEERLGFASPSGDIKPDGTFAISDVSEGTYHVWLTQLGRTTYLKSVRLAGQEVLESGLVISAVGARGTLQIVLSTAGAVVEGTVADADGLPLAGATAVLVPEGARRKIYRFYESETTDQNGRFVFHNVRPGDYKLFSWKDVEPGEWEEAEFLKPVEEKGVKITAEENGHRSVDLKVIPGTAAAGDSP